MDLILVMVAIAFAIVAAIWLLRGDNPNSSVAVAPSSSQALQTLPKKIDATADKPINFGYKNSWLAIHASDAEKVIETLKIDNLQSANWKTGVAAAYDGHTFVSPSVDGWVFIVSQKLPELGYEPDTEEWTSLLRELSKKFGDAQFFGTHRVVGYCAWARFKDGEEYRAFAYLGESGAILVDRGAPTSGEAELGYDYFDPNSPDSEDDAYWERDDLCYPDEGHVMEVAGNWSTNPTTLESKGLPAGIGWIGNIHRLSK